MSDHLDQLDQLKNMGPLDQVLGMMPGVDKKALQNVQVDDKQIERIKAIILSMTVDERRKPSIINTSRKKRIAAGSGTTVVDVNRLLKQFEMMQTMVKQMAGTKRGKFPGKGRLPFGF